MKFLVTGLPRCRTAWFAAYFTSLPDTVCWHEASLLTDEEMNVTYTNKGNSEAGPPEEWVEEFGPEKIVIVHRPIHEVYRSMEIIGQPTYAGFVESIEERNNKMDGLHVDFYDINLEEIHDYLGLPYDEYKAAMFNDMNVQSKHWRL